MTEIPGTPIRFIRGPMDGYTCTLSVLPDHVIVSGRTYTRIDDPDTGTFLGGYAHQGRSIRAQCEQLL